MSIVVGDLDNDGQRDRVFFEAHHATSILSSETALVLIAFTVVACITVLCWCVFFAISKRNRLASCLDPHLRKSTKDELPELGSGNSFVNQSFHPPGWKYTPESCGF
ncbi:hypothetical protein HPB47_007931 [Ixodes persulcatus]|uniref:Uncharacterized protein n=1 Tax=Ixodes persulcatus TaxID=34615 RepID=A0AC60P6G9_IXOPE|nr:hypothetical protein HPB47_007931 [Ixodes persulcatus]